MDTVLIHALLAGLLFLVCAIGAGYVAEVLHVGSSTTGIVAIVVGAVSGGILLSVLNTIVYLAGNREWMLLIGFLR